jgi:hypothetical protein
MRRRTLRLEHRERTKIQEPNKEKQTGKINPKHVHSKVNSYYLLGQ